MRLTSTARATLSDLAAKPYGVVSQRVAKPLLTAGLVQPVTLSPPPRQGMAVRITARGRGTIQR